MKRILIAACLLALAVPSLASAQSKSKVQATQRKQGSSTKAAASTPVPVANGTATLSPENTKIEFVGIHTNPQKPDPRLGGFSKFNGKLMSDGKTVSGVELEFQMDAIWTEIPGLTQHLKNADFFDTGKYPTAKFVSTNISASDKPGMVNVKGNLTLHGETAELEFPAKVAMSDQGVTMMSKFSLDRTRYGMDKKTEGVAKDVAITFSIGEATKTAGGSSRPSRQRANFDPDAMFKTWDKDGNGKLSGSEIPSRMQQGLKRIDTDGDGSISLEELKTRFNQARRNRGG